jgi:hypothetical protein
MVSALGARNTAARAAAAILESGGMSDLADMVREEGEKITPFEEEVLRLWSLACSGGVIDQPKGD